MTTYQTSVIGTLLLLSLFCLLMPLLVGFLIWLKRGRSILPRRRVGINRILVLSLTLLSSVWCLRYAVGLYVGELTAIEEAFNSFLHALQTFTLDEDYTYYILEGKRMVAALCGEGTLWPGVYGLYLSLLNLLSPMVGGAFLFEILAGIFPKIRLFCSYGAFWREKYFFSELNEMSLSLATGISGRAAYFKRPVIVFTDAYADGENEEETELLASAKLLGAICVRDDLLHLRKNRFGERKLFLTDEREADCLQKLAGLADAESAAFLKNAEVFFFVNSDAYVQVERSVVDILEKELSFSKEELPALIPVRGYRNLISDLLVKLPLFEPLVGQRPTPERTLTVTVIGAGAIGTEMLLSTYWFGQLLDCRLNLHVISDGPKEAFWDRLDAINPEIRRSADEKDPLLRINRKGEMACPYVKLSYTQCDASSGQLVRCLREDAGIAGTDYFLVSLGSDERNIAVADAVKRYLGEARLSSPYVKSDGACVPKRTVLAYVVYDPDLSDALNRRCRVSLLGGSCELYLRAVGNLRDVYSEENVTMTEYREAALRTDAAYHTLRGEETRESRARVHQKRLQDDYKYWANHARAMHLSYKAFSAGMITSSVFDEADDGAYQACRKKDILAYREYILKAPGDEEKLSLLHRLAWLEHRRWNAFTRVKGFRCPADYRAYAVPGQPGSYKQMELKLHPCLLECDQRGIRAALNADGTLKEEKMPLCTEHSEMDLLDELTYDLYDMGINGYDFKQYDYPREDF